MIQQIPIGDAHRPDDFGRDEANATTTEIAVDLAYKRTLLVNVVFFGDIDFRDRWVLIDAGIPGAADSIINAAQDRFGENARPSAIILTHGHFDHVGSLQTLAGRWDVPIYAHELELPYLTGQASYPAPDPTVGGGMMSYMSKLFPRGPYDFSRWLHVLPPNGQVPHMPGWRCLHTPGHTPGHVSLWRESDRTVIAGDAFTTTAQESAYAVMTQRPEMHGPPMYYTQNWQQARESVRKLAALEPEVVITGHGPAMQGESMRNALHELAERFDEVAAPEDGRYLREPARVQDGSAYSDPH